MKIKFLIIAFFIIIVTTVSFLFSPRPGPEIYKPENYVSLSSNAGFYVNCDADLYITLSQSPQLLLKDKEPRQSRPLYVMAGWLVGAPLQFFLEKSGLSGDFQRNLRGYYLGYVLLNFIILFISFVLFKKICNHYASSDVNNLVLYALMIFLASNSVTKSYFWTAHQQMFVFLTPLLCLFLIIKLPQKNLSLIRLSGVSFLLGTLTLAYGSFLLCLPCLLYAAFLVNKKHKGLNNFLKMALISAVFVAPTLLWMLILRLNGVTYYNHEADQYRQFVWIIDSLKVSPLFFLKTALGNLYLFILTFRGLVFFLALFLALFFAGRLMCPHNKNEDSKKQVVGILFAMSMVFLFFLCMGYYQVRLSFTMVPLLLCLMFIWASRLQKKFRYTGSLLLITAIAWHIYQTVSYGPFY
ncbi:MAG TPA: hypothetical protein PLT47_09765 [Bacteroidales bacterium]|nr:hypothetical protein [Bacteroidales bacterium]HQI71026.1 hypothetical protein [Bacteroidales bacterium]